MEFIDLIGLMRQSPDHPLLREHFRQANITRQPRPTPEDDTAFVQFPQDGYEMCFGLAADGVQAFLRSITCYPAGDPTHQKFTGKLPLDIQAGELQDDLIARLGTPVIQNKRFNIDAWLLGDLHVAVSYHKETHGVTRVQVNVPRP